MAKKRKTVLTVSKKDMELFGFTIPYDKFFGILSSLFAGVTILILFFLVYNAFTQIQLEQDFLDDPEIQRIDTLKGSLSEVEIFLEEEKQSLLKQKQAKAELEKERAQVEQVLDVDQETIDALFEVQESRLRKRIWRERIFGILLGFFTSLVAALTYGFVQRSLRNGKKKTKV